MRLAYSRAVATSSVWTSVKVAQSQPALETKATEATVSSSCSPSQEVDAGPATESTEPTNRLNQSALSILSGGRGRPETPGRRPGTRSGGLSSW
jgi:hypothetical protein